MASRLVCSAPLRPSSGCATLRPARDDAGCARYRDHRTAYWFGVSLRVVVPDFDPIDGARTYVNPEIIWASPEMILHQEGSVSMPDVNDEVNPMSTTR
jgi:hypothetical protein